jgi:hypothetical protein
MQLGSHVSLWPAYIHYTIKEVICMHDFKLIKPKRFTDVTDVNSTITDQDLQLCETTLFNKLRLRQKANT